MANGRILFISHLGSRTGAPIFLYYLLRHLDPCGCWEKRLFLRQGGELEAEFAEVCPTFVRDQGGKIAASRFCTSQGEWSLPDWQSFLIDWRPDLIYSNTVTNGELLAFPQSLGIPVIIHVQEAKPAFVKYTTGFLTETLNASHFICVSHAVGNYLVSDFGIPERRISVVHSGTDVDLISNSLDTAPGAIRAALGIPREAVVIGGAGWMSLHKGVDLWLQVARRVAVEAPDTTPHFMWIGFNADSYGEEMKRNVEQLGLQGRVIFTGAVPNPYPYINAMDIFVMSSRYESFGLVNIEAAYLGKPVVCFGCSGGPREIVEDDAGIVVEYLDTYEMAEAVILLARNDDLRNRLRTQAREKVIREFDIKQKASEIRTLISNVISRSS